MPDNTGRNFVYNQLRWELLSLAAGEVRQLIDVHESGEVFLAEFHTRSPKLAIEINVWGDGGSPHTIMDFHHDANKLLGLGVGLTPGMIAPIAGISPDPVGIPNAVHPYVTRYKDTTEADYTGDANKAFGILYTPAVSIPYTTRLQVTVINGDDSPATIKDVIISRRIFQEDVERPIHYDNKKNRR